VSCASYLAVLFCQLLLLARCACRPSDVVMASTSSPDLDDSEDFELTKRQAGRRSGPHVQKEQIRQLIDQRIAVNTKQDTNWVLSVWKSWSK